jgi:hypothetical protein
MVKTHEFCSKEARPMPQDRTPQLSFNLSRRLISIFLVSVLAVYTAGITVTLRLRRSAMQDWQTAYTAQAADFTDQLNTELLRIRTQMKYTLTRSVTLRLTLTPRQASFPALYDSILRMTEQVYTMQNTSSLIQSTTAYFPSLNKTIHSSGTYNDPTALEQQLIEAYYAAPGHSAVLTVGGRLYLVHKPERLTDLLVTLRENRLEPKRLQFVRHHPEASVSLVLVEARSGAKPGLTLQNDLILYTSSGEKTADYKRLYHEET